MNLKVEIGKQDERVSLRLSEMSEELKTFLCRKGFTASDGTKIVAGSLTMFRSNNEITLSANDTSSDFRDFETNTDRDKYFDRLVAAFEELSNTFNTQPTLIEF